MKKLISAIKNVTTKKHTLPFSVYSSTKKQTLLNVPIVKPLFIAVLSGDKELGSIDKFTCHTGDFIFLSDALH